MNEYKKELLDTLEMLSNIDRQNSYYHDVKIANVTSDFICGWFDTGFFPESDGFRSHFTQEEWDVLIEFNNYFDERVDKLPDEFDDLIQNPYWLEVVEKAKTTLVKLKILMGLTQ